MVMSFSSRLQAVDGATVAPRYDAVRTLTANVRELAQWEWGARRADWAADLAADVVRADPGIDRPGVAAEWTAAILCAAAADSGRSARASTWARTLGVIEERTGVPRATALARWSELEARDHVA